MLLESLLLSLAGGCTGSSDSTLFKMPHCWKSHVTAHMYLQFGVVMDAGSSHTNLFVYKWNGEKLHDTALARQAHICKVKGILLL